MRARFLVMKIASQSPPQQLLVPHNDVIQALAANRSDQSFHIWILPRHRGDVTTSSIPMLFVRATNSPPTIASLSRIRYFGASHGNASRICCCRPLCARMIRHVEVHHTAAVMRQDDEDKQRPEGRSRHSEEIHRGRLLYFM